MEITSFNPIILSNDADPIIELFEDLGFERKHRSVLASGAVSVDMVNEKGFRVDVAKSSLEIPRDMTLIRMNVRDFEAAYEILKAHGFTNTRGEELHEGASFTEATMVSPSGVMIALTLHKRKAE